MPRMSLLSSIDGPQNSRTNEFSGVKRKSKPNVCFPRIPPLPSPFIFHLAKQVLQEGHHGRIQTSSSESWEQSRRLIYDSSSSTIIGLHHPSRTQHHHQSRSLSTVHRVRSRAHQTCPRSIRFVAEESIVERLWTQAMGQVGVGGQSQGERRGTRRTGQSF